MHEPIIIEVQIDPSRITDIHLRLVPTPAVPAPALIPSRAKVIDVSRWQAFIDWPKVRNVAAVEYAMIRATNGTVNDTRFAFNWQAAKAAGVRRGAYHYWQNEFSPQTQAAAFIAALDRDFGELPWALDIEDGQPPFTQAELPDLRVWLDIVEANTGKRGFIYTGRSVWNFPNETWATAWQLWQAAYSNSGYQPIPPWPHPCLWQHTSRGVIPGITANTVDLNTAGDGLTRIVPDWYWRGCSVELKNAQGQHPNNFFVNALANPLPVYDAPRGELIENKVVTWRMMVQAVTADGWLKVHRDGATEWWVRAESVGI